MYYEVLTNPPMPLVLVEYRVDSAVLIISLLYYLVGSSFAGLYTLTFISPGREFAKGNKDMLWACLVLIPPHDRYHLGQVKRSLLSVPRDGDRREADAAHSFVNCTFPNRLVAAAKQITACTAFEFFLPAWSF
jgi:hypothetical protein